MDKSDLIKKYERYLNAAKKYLQLQEEYENMSQHYAELFQKETEIRNRVPGIIWIFIIVSVIIGGSCFSILGIIIGGIVGLVIGSLVVHAIKADDKIEKEADKYHESSVVPVERRCEQIQKLIDNHVDSPVMQQLFDDVPEDFRTVSALEFCIKMLKNRQADTEKECYNLYMEYVQRQQMIDLQDQQIALGEKMLEEQKVQTKMTAELHETARQQKKSMEEMAKKQRKISKQVRYGNAVNTLNLLKKK